MVTNSMEKLLWETIAKLASKTNCKKRAVGCVIYNTVSKQIVGKGYNVHPDGGCDCNTTKTAIHAEVSALNSMKIQYPRENLIAFVGHQPCFNCGVALETVVKEVRYRSQD